MDHTALNPAVLKPGLTTPDGANLKPSLVTPAYAGGTPAAAGDIKPGLRNADGTLKAGLVSGEALKPSLMHAGGGGTPAFNPGDYGSLALDLNAALGAWQDAGGTIAASANDAPVRVWQDQSGNSRHAVAASDAARPLLKTNVTNNQPALLFDGSNDFLSGSGLSSLSAAELFIVLRRGNEFDNGGFMGTSTENQHYPFSDGNVYDPWGTTVRKSTGNPAQDLTQWHIYNVVSVSGEWTSRFNGVQHYTTATNTVGFGANYHVGAGNAGTLFMAGSIARLLVYSAKLTTNNRNALHSQLSGIYGISP